MHIVLIETSAFAPAWMTICQSLSKSRFWCACSKIASPNYTVNPALRHQPWRKRIFFLARHDVVREQRVRDKFMREGKYLGRRDKVSVADSQHSVILLVD